MVGWEKFITGATSINAACYKSLSADHMIKTAEKHQTLYILKKREHHHFQTKDIGTYTEKWQPHVQRVMTTGSWWAPPQNCTSRSIQAQQEKGRIRDRLVLITQDTNPVSFSWKRCTPSKLPPKKHRTQRSKKLWDTEHQNEKGQDLSIKEKRDEERALQWEWKTPLQRTNL